MTTYFYAHEMSNGIKTNWFYMLDPGVVLWLSKNLRKRPTDDGRRYNYISTSTTKPYSYRLRIRYNTGVKIYNEEDAMAFKLRWT